MKASKKALGGGRGSSAPARGGAADFVFDPGDQNLRKGLSLAIAPGKVDLAVDNVGECCSTRW